MGMKLAIVVLESEKLGIYSGMVSSTPAECRACPKLTQKKKQSFH